jgi:hypothetical protein
MKPTRNSSFGKKAGETLDGVKEISTEMAKRFTIGLFDGFSVGQ